MIRGLKEEYPTAILNLYSNTDHNSTQEKLINALWPSYFAFTYQVTRASQEYKINSNFGVEVYNASYQNIIESDKKLIESADLVRNLHLDCLDFLNYPECIRYFNSYPRAEISLDFSEKYKLPSKFILCHPFSRADSDRKLEDWYVQRLIKLLSEKHFIIIPTEEKHLPYYDFCKDWNNVSVLTTDLYETWWLAQNCSGFLGVDSSIRYFSLCRPEIPNFVFNKYSAQPFQCPPFQSIRWAINPKATFPLNFDCNFVVKALSLCMDDYAYYLYPELMLQNISIDNAIVRRKYLNYKENH